MYDEIFLKRQSTAVKRQCFLVCYKKNTFSFPSKKLSIDGHSQQGGGKPSLTDF